MIESPIQAAPSRRFVRLLAAFTAFAGLLPVAVAAPQGPFVAVGAGVWNAAGDPVLAEVWDTDASGPVQVETGSTPDAFGSFRASFGSNGFSALGSGGIDREVYGGSIWTDGFVVGGGSGDGVLDVSAHIEGTVAGHGSLDYALYVSTTPFDFQVITDSVAASDAFWNLELPGATRVLYAAVANRCGLPLAIGDCGHVPFENHQGPLALTLTGAMPFTYGSPLYVASLFAGGLGAFGGSMDFLNSADFGVTAPVGATLQSVSGASYAAAVPEPSVTLMFGAGLAAAWLLRRIGTRGSALASGRWTGAPRNATVH